MHFCFRSLLFLIILSPCFFPIFSCHLIFFFHLPISFHSNHFFISFISIYFSFYTSFLFLPFCHCLNCFLCLFIDHNFNFFRLLLYHFFPFKSLSLFLTSLYSHFLSLSLKHIQTLSFLFPQSTLFIIFSMATFLSIYLLISCFSIFTLPPVLLSS